VSVDHVAQILARLPEHLKDLPGWEAWITSFGEEFQELEDAFVQLRDERTIDTATGVTLEDIGRRVGEPPSGLDEEIYRRRIRARIAANRSKGRVKDLIRVARLVLAETDGTVPVVTLARERYATMLVQILGDAVSEDLADTLIAFLRAATKGTAAAGVRILLETSAYPPEERFSFEGGPGLGYGIAATLDLDAVHSEVDTVLRASVVGTDGHAITLAFAPTGSGAGTLSNVGNAWTFEYEDSVTTVADFEAAVAASDNEAFHVLIDGTGATVITDSLTATAFSGGVDGGRYSGARE
jgi:hypothetical protein